MKLLQKIRTPTLIVAFGFILTLVFVYFLELQKYSDDSTYNIPLVFDTSNAHDEIKDSAQTKVDLGIYPLEVYDIDFQRNTYGCGGIVSTILL